MRGKRFEPGFRASMGRLRMAASGSRVRLCRQSTFSNAVG